MIFLVCSCVCLRFSLLTLTLRVSPGVEDLAGVWERRLLGTVVKPEDSTATAALLKAREEAAEHL